MNKSGISDPDMRDTRLEIREDGTFGLNVGVGAGVDRYFRELNEDNQSIKIDSERAFGVDNKMRFGGVSTFKSREFELYQYYFRNWTDKEITGEADDLLSNEMVWNPNSDEGIYVRGTFNPSNQYESKMKNHGLYAMTELSLIQDLKFVGGVRMEIAKMNYTGQDQNNNVLSDSLLLDELNILPSMNLIYSLNENMNLRGSFNQTLARPTFKEKSNVQIYDPITARTFIGNLKLNQTYINNYDFRWEFFYSRSEMVSVSAFYKQFDGHIELTSFKNAPDQVTPRNAGQSTVAGVEIEFRKDLTELFSFGMNASFVKSNSRISQSPPIVVFTSVSQV